jgi:hypothetical protein
MQDLGYAFRVLRHSPAFAAVAVLSLALGIGARPGFLGMSRGGFFAPMDVTLPLHAQPAVCPNWGPPGESLFTSDLVFWIHSMARIREGTPIGPLQARLSKRDRC